MLLKDNIPRLNDSFRGATLETFFSPRVSFSVWCYVARFLRVVNVSFLPV